MSIALLQKGLHLLYPLNFQPPQDVLQSFFLQPLPPEPAVHHKAAEGGGFGVAFRPLVQENPSVSSCAAYNLPLRFVVPDAKMKYKLLCSTKVKG